MQNTTKNRVKRSLILNISDKSSLNPEVLSLVDFLVFSPEVYTVEVVEDFLSHIKKIQNDKKIFLGLPVRADFEDIALLRKILGNCRLDGVLADNLYGIGLAKEFGIGFIAGTGLNIYNSASASYFIGQGGTFIYSAELNIEEISEIEAKLPQSGFVFVHGDMRAMTLSHCPFQVFSNRTCGDCAFEKGVTYQDKKGYSFPLRRMKLSKCHFELYNSAKLSTFHRLKGKEINLYFVLFNTPAQQVCDIIKKYIQSSTKEINGKQSLTTGHLFKGVK